MRVFIERGLDRVEKLTGAVVILDIYRAGNTIMSLLASGAQRVVLLSDLEGAYQLKRENPDWLLMGERGGVTQPGFDGGNSPCQARVMPVAGRTVVLTTSAGTQAVHRLGQASHIFFGSFANAAALCAELRRLDPDSVHLLPMGLEAREPAMEDDLAALYLEQCLLGNSPDFKKMVPQLLNCDGSGRLRSLKQDDDLKFCTSLNTHEMIPRVVPGAPPFAIANR